MKLHSPRLQLLCIPIAVNLIVGGVVYLPQRARLRRWQEARMLVEEKPKLEGLLHQSREVIASWEPTRFSKKDPAAVVETLQRMAGRHDLQVKNIRTGGSSRAGTQKRKNGEASGRSAPAKAGGFSTVAVDLDLAGSFSRLTRWIDEVESQYGLRIDSWSMTGDREPGQPMQMAARLTAFLEDLSQAASPAAVRAQGSLERTTRQLEQALRLYGEQMKERGEYDGLFRRDPLQPLVNSQGQPVGILSTGREGMWIQGIIWSPNRPLVVVDDRLFGQGDVIGPYKILAIHPDRVVAQRGDQPETIALDRPLQKDASRSP